MSRRPAGPLVRVRLAGRLGAYAAELPRRVERRLAEAGREAGLGPDHEVSVLLCDGPAIRRLNARWRGKDKPTDVLSFPLHEPDVAAAPPPGPIGDVVVALPVVRRQAAEAGVGFESRLARLLVHGLLHLMGHDHERDADARRMEREERRLLGEDFR